jgi:hypothetical protein
MQYAYRLVQLYRHSSLDETSLQNHVKALGREFNRELAALQTQGDTDGDQMEGGEAYTVAEVIVKDEMSVNADVYVKGERS